jgi:site-specific DNA-methyltransferase (adenine-specific)
VLEGVAGGDAVTPPVIIGDCTLYLGDCREILPTLPKVDAVVTDPPFSVPVKYHDADGDFPRSWGDLAVMEPFFTDILEKVRGRCRDDSQVYVCCDANTYPIFYKAAMPVWPRSQMIVWYKPTGRRGNGWKHSHELVLHLATAWTTYSEKFHQDVVGIMPVRTLCRQHPAEKPGELCEFLLEATTEQHVTILDPFMGSGTTGVACVNLGRKFIGIEIEPRYFEIACKRIEAAERQGKLPLRVKAEQLAMVSP